MSEGSSAAGSYTLTLFSDGLLSKWGFSDGDEPETLQDFRDAISYKWRSDWHTVLTRLVRNHLLPALDQHVEVYEMGTNHNPVRAQVIDGSEVSDAVIYGNEPEPRLTPEHVEVTWEQIARADALSVGARPTPR